MERLSAVALGVHLLQVHTNLEIGRHIVEFNSKAYRNVQRKHGDNWEAAFRAKLEQDLPSKDLMFLLGTIHRFPHQRLLISLIYPPKPPAENPNQAGLF